eukprot:scaffold27008_cov67-Phaeocystis_antarctica.AAC.2
MSRLSAASKKPRGSRLTYTMLRSETWSGASFESKVGSTVGNTSSLGRSACVGACASVATPRLPSMPATATTPRRSSSFRVWHVYVFGQQHAPTPSYETEPGLIL